MTFLEVLCVGMICVGMSGYLAFYAVRSGTCAVASIAEGPIPAAIFQFDTAGVLGTGDGGKSAPIAALALVAACAGAFVGTRIPSRAPVTHWWLSESAAALPVSLTGPRPRR